MSKYPPISLLSAWSMDKQKKFLDGLKIIYFNHEQVVFEKGDTSSEVYFILAGAIRAFNYNTSGKLSYLRMRSIGDCFGYYNGISQTTRTATMAAVGETKLAQIDGPAFFSLVLDNPEIGRNFIKLIVELLEMETKRITNMTLMSSHQRVAAELLEIPMKENTPYIEIPDRIEFASYLNMTRESLSRALNYLKKRCFIRVSGNQIYIDHTKGLQDFMDGLEQPPIK